MTAGDTLRVDGVTTAGVGSTGLDMVVDFYDDAANTMLHWKQERTKIVRTKHYPRSGWSGGDDEGGMPFKIGQAFVVLFSRTADGWEMTIDGKRLPVFDYKQSQQKYETGSKVASIKVSEGAAKPKVFFRSTGVRYACS